MRVPYYPVTRWHSGGQVYNPGEAGPRSNPQAQGLDPRVWPTIYSVPARGLGAMPLFQLGVTIPIINNQYAGGQPMRALAMPGLFKSPF